MATRVDFKHVRQHADFDRVLASYGIELKKDGTKPGQFKALCPFHEDSNPSLKVNTERNVFHCFACEAKGNVLEFVRDMDGLDDSELRQAALKIVELCGIAPNAGGKAPTAKAKGTKGTAKSRDTAPLPPQPPAETPADEELDGDLQNRVLTFELKLGLDDALKVWLEARGLNHHAQREFGLGRASKRSKTIADRLAIPLHNAKGELIGYCGRYVGDDVPGDQAKYILPGGFRKDFELFNFHRAFKPDVNFPAFVVMESYFSVMRHHGAVTCVSPMGHELSNRQLELLAKRFPTGNGQLVPRAVVIADGDEPGRDGAARVAGKLATHFWTQTVHLPDGVKPHHLKSEELTTMLRAIWKDER